MSQKSDVEQQIIAPFGQVTLGMHPSPHTLVVLVPVDQDHRSHEICERHRAQQSFYGVEIGFLVQMRDANYCTWSALNGVM